MTEFLYSNTVSLTLDWFQQGAWSRNTPTSLAPLQHVGGNPSIVFTQLATGWLDKQVRFEMN